MAELRSSIPPLQLCIRRKEGYNIYQKTNDKNKIFESITDINISNGNYYSSNGNYLAILTSLNIQLYDCNENKIIGEIERANVLGIHFSPLSNFICIWEKPSKDKNNHSTNYNVYSCKSLQHCIGFYNKEFEPSTFGYPLQWSSDEKVMVHIMTNSLSFYDGNLVDTAVKHKLYVEGVSQFQVAPNVDAYRVATFTPGKKSAPGSIKIWQYPKFEPQDFCYSKSVFQADRADLKFNSTGSHILMHCHTDMDATGAVYGEGSQLYLASWNGSLSVNVPFKGNGLVQAVEWSPKGNDFIAIHGRSPFLAILFSAKDCTPIFEFGQSAVNTINWSPNGRFVVLAGFKNLSGQMEFWDKDILKKMGSGQHHSARIYEWGPDGRSFVTAVVHPFRRVDNCFKIWKYSGELIYEESMPELYQASFRPATSGVFPDLPKSPKSAGDKIIAAALAPQPVKQYIPPHLRNNPAAMERIKANSLNQVESSGPRLLDKFEQDKFKSQMSGSSGPRVNYPIGLQPSSDAKPKSSTSTVATKGVETQVVAPKPVVEDFSKQIKAIQKKLKQVDMLKYDQAHGEKLDDEQMSKLNEEEELRKELSRLLSLDSK